MGILKKFNEFLEAPKYQGMDSSQDEKEMEPSTGDLKAALDKLAQDGGELEWNQYKITLPSELNSEGEPKTYLIDKGGKHLKASSEEEVEKVVTEQVVFESYRASKRKRTR